MKLEMQSSQAEEEVSRRTEWIGKRIIEKHEN